MARNKRSIPLGSGWSISLNRKEVFPDDPGQGAPAMVYGPFGKSATFACALDTGQVSDGNCEDFDIPAHVYRKMEAAVEEVDRVVDAWFEAAKLRADALELDKDGMDPLLVREMHENADRLEREVA